jgi:two-component system response regulator HydG
MESRVLIVDDDAEMRESLRDLFSSEGHGCNLAADGQAALELVDNESFDVVVCDVVMDGMGGLEFLDRVRRTHPALPVIVITAAGGVAQAVDAIKRGAFEYVLKPCDVDDMRRVVASALEDRRRPSQVVSIARASSAPSKNALLGDSPAMRALQATVDMVARSSAPVLVNGETGVGKELVARAIHERSARAERPFIAVNMSAIPEALLEAELFGHIRGAFTGAVQPRKGLFTSADGGTLMLDEIGDMSFGLQAKLLRVLQSGDVRPVGSERAHHVDVRVIAVTHRDLRALVKEGRFREDLYFRLHVLPVFVPPLRERREDIPVLAEYFLASAQARAPLSPARALGADTLRKLCEAPWPGNVRELASAMERAVVFGLDELPETDRELPQPAARETPLAALARPGEPPWTLRRLSRAYAERVLAETGGDKQRAAEILGIDLSTLYRWQRARD